MKTYLRKAKYQANYEWLIDCRELDRLPEDLSEIINETKFTKIVFQTSWLVKNHTKQSLVRFAKWAYQRYYKQMVYFLSE